MNNVLTHLPGDVVGYYHAAHRRSYCNYCRFRSSVALRASGVFYEMSTVMDAFFLVSEDWREFSD